jgi:hypothetical protein
MDMSVSISAFVGFLGFFLVVHLLFVVWPRLVVDFTRQKLFGIRDRLFDLAVAGELSFDSEAYKNIMAILNLMTRSAEHATLWNYERYARVFKKHGVRRADEFLSTVKDERTSPRAIREAYAEALRAYAQLPGTRSPLILCCVTAPCALVRPISAALQCFIGPSERREEAAIKADILGGGLIQRATVPARPRHLRGARH